MKRFVTIALALVMFLTLAATFCSCDGKDDSPAIEEAPAAERIKLTATNFEEYFAVNVLFDYQTVHLYRDIGDNDHYDIFCNATITTSPKGNYTYENVEVEYTLSYFGWTEPDPLYKRPQVSIGVDGYSEATFTMFKEDAIISNILDSTFESTRKSKGISFVNVTGTVIIPAE